MTKLTIHGYNESNDKSSAIVMQDPSRKFAEKIIIWFLRNYDEVSVEDDSPDSELTILFGLEELFSRVPNRSP